MDVGVQFLLAGFATCVIGLPIVFYKYKRYRLEGKSIKYLEFKVAMAVGMPIGSIPVLLSDMTAIWKLISIIAMLLSGIAYAYSITSARRSLRRTFGLPPEDEDKGEVIKKDNIKE
jgi:amino acid transporter